MVFGFIARLFSVHSGRVDSAESPGEGAQVLRHVLSGALHFVCGSAHSADDSQSGALRRDGLVLLRPLYRSFGDHCQLVFIGI